MLQNNVMTGFCHLLIAVIIGVIACQRKGVPLLHAYMPESSERIGSLIEIGTVAGHVGSLMKKMHTSLYDLCIGTRTVEVVKQFVGMYKIHLLVGFRRGTLARTGLFRLYQT